MDQMAPPAKITHIGFEELVGLLRDIFLQNDTSPEVAELLSRNCAGCERDGSLSHGIFRMPGYVSSLRSGWVDGMALPIVEDDGGGMIRVDARNGFAQPALEAGAAALAERTRMLGIAMLAIRDSHHFSALWPDIEPFARQGLVALSFVNSFACVAPHDGKRPVFGTNPMAFAAPRVDGDPYIFDQAASSMANGDVRIAARQGKALPPGMAVDAEARPTTDPASVLEGGALLPFGGHKGGSLAFMIEVLGAALTGGQFSFEVDWSAHPGAETPKTGQVVILIDPARGGNRLFVERMETLVERVRQAGQHRLPGDRRYSLRREAEQRGISVETCQLAQVRALIG